MLAFDEVTFRAFIMFQKISNDLFQINAVLLNFLLSKDS